MGHCIRVVGAIAVLVFFTPCPGSAAQEHLRPSAGEAPAAELAKALIKRGYVEVPVTLNKTGLLDVKAEVEGLAAVFVVDTGSNNINLDRSMAKRAGLIVREVEGKTAAFGDAVATAQAKIANLSLGKISSPAETCVVDFGRINDMRKAKGDAGCDGILGGSFLIYYSAVLDYGHRKLYLLDPDHRAKNSSKRFGIDGFTEVTLDLNRSCELDVKVKANGVCMLMCVDTGTTPDPILDPDSARRAKLEVRDGKGTSTDVGGTHPNQTATIDRFTVGGVTCPLAVRVQDVSASNQLRKAEGVSAIDGTLGGAFFENHSAIIDYGRCKLYLSLPARR